MNLPPSIGDEIQRYEREIRDLTHRLKHLQQAVALTVQDLDTCSQKSPVAKVSAENLRKHLIESTRVSDSLQSG